VTRHAAERAPERPPPDWTAEEDRPRPMPAKGNVGTAAFAASDPPTRFGQT
jgi:hypothetical protein